MKKYLSDYIFAFFKKINPPDERDKNPYCQGVYIILSLVVVR